MRAVPVLFLLTIAAGLSGCGDSERRVGGLTEDEALAKINEQLNVVQLACPRKAPIKIVRCTAQPDDYWLCELTGPRNEDGSRGNVALSKDKLPVYSTSSDC